jgi:hypothetical protein
MINGLILFAAMLLNIVGCGYYALSQRHHWKTVTKPSVVPLNEKRLQLFSLLALSASLILYVVEESLSFAMLLWPLSISLGVFSVAMILTFRPTMLRLLIGFF